jgi:HPt (histidine-containing phosphotransfer) domain-containing protein
MTNARLTQDDPPRLDLAGALDAMDNDRELYGTIIDVYLNTVPGILSEMLSAFSAGDLQTAIRNAHSLKSSSRSVGALKLGTAAELIEKSAQTLSSAKLRENVDQLKKEFCFLCSELAAEGFKVPLNL